MLAQKLIFSYYNKIGLQLLQIIASIIVARAAGASVLGTVAFGLAYVSIFTTVADLGFGTAHMKMISGGEEPKKCLGTFVPVKLFLIVAFVLIVLGFFLLQTLVFNVTFESREHIFVIFILLASVSIHELFAIPKTTYGAYTQIAKSVLPETLRAFIHQVFRIIIVLVGFRAIELALGQLAAVLIVIPIFGSMFFKEYEIGSFDKVLFKKYLIMAVPLIFIGLSTKLSSHIGKVLLQFYTNSEVVGYYAAAFRFGSFVLLIGQSVTNLFFPTFSAAFRTNDQKSILNKLIKFERFSFIFVMPFVILVTLNTDIIINVLLGQEFSASIPIMKTINFAMFLMVASVPFGAVITGKGQFGLAAKINIFNFILYFIALVVLIHPSLLGLEGLGAAVGLMLSYLFIGLFYRMVAAQYIDNLNHRMAFIYIIYGTLNYLLFSYLIDLQFIENILFFRLIYAVVYTLLTYLSLYLFGMLKKDDLDLLSALIDFKKLKFYVGNELNKK